MKPIRWLTSALLVSAMAMPCAMAQGFYEGNGAANLPSQRTVNEAPEGTGAVLTLSPATVRRVQQELNRLGYNAGPVSGSWDRMTSIAVADFQRAHGLSPVGTLDEATMRMLGVAMGGGEVAGAGGYRGMNGAFGGVNGGYGAGMERGYGMNGANSAGMNGAYDGSRINANPNAPGIGLSAGNISGANGMRPYESGPSGNEGYRNTDGTIGAVGNDSAEGGSAQTGVNSGIPPARCSERGTANGISTGDGNGAFGAGGSNDNSAETINGGSGSTGASNTGSGAGMLSGAAGTATTGAASGTAR